MARRPSNRQVASLVERMRSLWKVKNAAVVKQELANEYPEDIAAAMSRLPLEEGIEILNKLEQLQAANVMVELPTETARQYIKILPDEVVAAYLDILPMDDAIDLQEELEPERFDALLEVIPDEDAREIRRLMQYPRGSVGRIMTERFFEVGPETTMEGLLSDLRTSSQEKYESVNDIYVLDGAGFLQGVFSLRKALRAEQFTRAKEIMKSDVVHATVDEPDEDAARRMAKYGLYALPVLDERGRMMGLFTGDDAQTILREADTKDVLALGGVTGTAESYLSLNVWKLYRRRIPWLAALFVAETLTGGVLRHYGQVEGGLKINPLMFFVPLIIGAGGNAGSQVTTTITRALALKEVDHGDWFLVFSREVVVALLVGTTLSLMGFLRAYFGWNSGLNLSLIVAFALPSVVLWAAMVGSLLPIAAKRLKIDPAVMSAPFITTFVDATGLIIYFEIALKLLGSGTK